MISESWRRQLGPSILGLYITCQNTAYSDRNKGSLFRDRMKLEELGLSSHCIAEGYIYINKILQNRVEILICCSSIFMSGINNGYCNPRGSTLPYIG